MDYFKMLIILQFTKQRVPTHASRKRGRGGGGATTASSFISSNPEKRRQVFAHLKWHYIYNTNTKNSDVNF